MRKRILYLAIPSIITNLTVPLMGLFDVAIVGHLQNTSFIGAIAIGGMMFNLLYWGFGFLRMGTGGLTAQAFGRKDVKDIPNQLLRPLLLALGASFLILLFSRPLEWIILNLVGDPYSSLNHWASVYFRICVWGAPAVLSMYAFNGWFIGLQNPKIPMYVAIVANVLNVVLSLFFVYGMEMQLKGVALGTMLGQWIGFLLSLIFCWKKYKIYFKRKFYLTEILDAESLVQYFHVNKNIFGRTVCLIAVTVSFTAFGAKQGETLLAVNTLMMQLFTVFSYFMDGFAYAGEALVGAYVGEKNTLKLYETIHSLFFWGWTLAVLFTLIYSLGGKSFLSLLTDQREILEACVPYIGWSALIPLCGFSAFMWDGIFIGMTETKMMFQVMLISMLLYFVLYFILFPIYGNHGLWIAFLLYLSLRGCGLWFLFVKKFKTQC